MTSPVALALDELLYNGIPVDPVAAVAMLDSLSLEVAEMRASIADRRAEVIAGLARASSARAAADRLGMSLAAVAKAMARGQRAAL